MAQNLRIIGNLVQTHCTSKTLYLLCLRGAQKCGPTVLGCLLSHGMGTGPSMLAFFSVGLGRMSSVGTLKWFRHTSCSCLGQGVVLILRDSVQQWYKYICIGASGAIKRCSPKWSAPPLDFDLWKWLSPRIKMRRTLKGGRRRG